MRISDWSSDVCSSDLPESGAKTVTSPFIEHVNLTVSDPDRTAGILSAIFGWHERWRGPARDGGHTIHLGSAAAYIALYTGPAGEQSDPRYPQGPPHNTVGVPRGDPDTPARRSTVAGKGCADRCVLG